MIWICKMPKFQIDNKWVSWSRLLYTIIKYPSKVLRTKHRDNDKWTMRSRIMSLDGYCRWEFLFTVTFYLCVITARKRSCWEVMFLHLSVILFTGGCMAKGGMHDEGGCAWWRGCSRWWGACVARGHACRRDRHWSGQHTFYWNAFLFSRVVL